MNLSLSSGSAVSSNSVNQAAVLSPKNFLTIVRLAKSIAGLDINESKHDLVVTRLLRRLRALGIDDFDKYCSYINSVQGDEERSHMVSALTTNTTSFFREGHHFSYLKNHLTDLSVQHRPLRIWCAAASSGEEAYSAAFTVCSLSQLSRSHDVRILATDINPHVIAAAREGVYDLTHKDRIPNAYYKNFCHENLNGKTFSVREAARSLIRFQQLNLLSVWPMQQKFDAIFCRNVVIYFDKDTRCTLWRRLVERLQLGGELYVGHSERIDAPEKYGLKSFGTTAYRKISS